MKERRNDNCSGYRFLNACVRARHSPNFFSDIDHLKIHKRYDHFCTTPGNYTLVTGIRYKDIRLLCFPSSLVPFTAADRCSVANGAQQIGVYK